MVPNGKVMPNYRIVTVVKPPFVMYDSEKNEWSGYCIDLITYLSAMLEFTYNVQLTPDGKFGSMDENGTWDGMIRELQDNEADIALGALSVMSERATVVDFSIPFYDAVGTTMLMRKREVKTIFFLFARVFSIRLWSWLFGCYLTASILMWIFDRWSPYSYQNNLTKVYEVNDKRVFTLGESLWFAFSSITPTGGGEAPKNYSGRLAVATWWFYEFIMIACYTALLAAGLTFSHLHTPLESLQDFTRQYRYEFAPIKPSEAYTYFERMSHIESRLHKAWEKLIFDDTFSEIEQAGFGIWEFPIEKWNTKLLKFMNKSGFPANLEQAFDRVNTSRFALIGDATDIKYIVRTHCDFIMVGEEFSRRPYGIAVQKDSILKDQLDKAIIQLTRDGILEKLKDLWWNEKINRPKCPREYKINDGMAISDFGGIFVIIIVGIFLAIATLSFEFWWFRCWLPRKHCRCAGGKKNSAKPKLWRFTAKPGSKVAIATSQKLKQRC